MQSGGDGGAPSLFNGPDGGTNPQGTLTIAPLAPSQTPSCAGLYEKCTTTADCCASPGVECINGVCTQTQAVQ